MSTIKDTPDKNKSVAVDFSKELCSTSECGVESGGCFSPTTPPFPKIPRNTASERIQKIEDTLRILIESNNRLHADLLHERDNITYLRRENQVLLERIEDLENHKPKKVTVYYDD